jgi:hypothetical protein
MIDLCEGQGQALPLQKPFAVGATLVVALLEGNSNAD